jgi:acetyl esterase/lipase
MYASLKSPCGPHARNHYDLFIPDRAEHQALVACFHGGWWSQGRHEDLRLFCLALAEAGFPCATIDFRSFADGARSGQDILDDARAGVTKALEEAAIQGQDGASLILLGSGSGSMIALNLAAQLSEDPHVRVRAAIACGVSPSLEHGDGLAPQVVKAVDQFAGAQRHALSPLHLRPETFPPLLLLHGDNDNDVPPKLAHKFHLRVVEGGEQSTLAVLSSLGHQFIENPLDRGGKAALERIVPFLQEHANPLSAREPAVRS